MLNNLKRQGNEITGVAGVRPAILPAGKPSSPPLRHKDGGQALQNNGGQAAGKSSIVNFPSCEQYGNKPCHVLNKALR